MKKIKAFFNKIGDYIKNTAWIQPLLIVIVIFVILFSLSPLTEAIKKGWTKITTVNKMEEITYGEYVEKVKDQGSKENSEDFIIVFTRNDCDQCPDLYKAMNTYLKSDEYKNADFKIYNVNLSLKSSKVKINGTKYAQYKDKTCGLAISPTENDNNIIYKDYVNYLDQRIEAFVSDGVGADVTYSDLSTLSSSDSAYTYVGTPLIMWYSNGMETRISNTFSTSSEISWANEKVTPSSFRNYIEDFEGSVKVENWDESFDLTYNTLSNIKDAFK